MAASLVETSGQGRDMSDQGAHEYTTAQLTDEAVRMLTRRLRRLHPDAYTAVITSLAPALRDALTMADNRADKLMQTDQAAGITRRALTIAEQVEREIAQSE